MSRCPPMKTRHGGLQKRIHRRGCPWCGSHYNDVPHQYGTYERTCTDRASCNDKQKKMLDDLRQARIKFKKDVDESKIDQPATVCGYPYRLCACYDSELNWK